MMAECHLAPSVSGSRYELVAEQTFWHVIAETHLPKLITSCHLRHVLILCMLGHLTKLITCAMLCQVFSNYEKSKCML